MSKIDLRKLVNINIQSSNFSTSSSIRDTVVLITNESNIESHIVSSKVELEQRYPKATYPLIEKYGSVFFDNGGSKLLVLPKGADDLDTITNLDDKYIVVAIIGLSFSDAKNLATSLDNLKGIHRKILLVRTTNSDLTIPASGVEGEEGYIPPQYIGPTLANYDSLAIKFSDQIGAEMAIGAYLSRIRVYGSNTVQDYCFTPETIKESTTPKIDNSLYDALQEANWNFNLELGGAVRNIGGNLGSGKSLVNEYMLIVCHQTLTEALLKLLVTKIKGNSALAAIRAVLTQELNNYVINGYLTKDKIWENEDWVVERNGVNYPIISKNHPLTQGFHIQVLPLSSLTSAEKAEHKTPPIYVILADSYSIRVIEVNGGVI